MNFLGALGAIGRLLPGYVQGERQAIQDNWSDLNNYNTTQAGQLENAYTEATFQPRVSQAYDEAEMSRMGVMDNDMVLQQNMVAQPGILQERAYTSAMGLPNAVMNQDLNNLMYQFSRANPLQNYNGYGNNSGTLTQLLQQALMGGV